MCEIRLTKLSCAAQQVGIVHFYAMTEIKGLSCRLWRMREWRNLLTSVHVGYRSVIRAVASGASLKFGVQGASATNWFSRVNGARDNGIRLYLQTFSGGLCDSGHTSLTRVSRHVLIKKYLICFHIVPFICMIDVCTLSNKCFWIWIFTRGSTSTIFAMSVSRNSQKYKYIFMFPKTYFAWQGLTLYVLILCEEAW